MEANKKEKKTVSQEKISTSNTYSAKAFRNGSFSIAIIAIAIVMVVVLNLLIGLLPANITKIDVTAQQLLKLSDATKELAEGLTEDVHLYYIVTAGGEDPKVEALLSRYAALSPRISVTKVDPEINPQFVAQYTDDTVSSGGVLVAGPWRAKALDYQPDLYDPVYDMSYVYTGSVSSYEFDGENSISSAIDFVCRADLPTVGLLTGYGDNNLDATWTGYLEDENIQLVNLTIKMTKEIDPNYDALLLYGPTADLSAEDADLISAYLRQGGKLMLVSDFDTVNNMPNLTRVMQEYGMEAVPGMVCETDPSYYYEYNYFLYPSMYNGDILGPVLDDDRAVLASAVHGIRMTEENFRSTITLDPLLETSQTAYAKANMATAQSMAKEEGDLDGPFYLAMTAEEVVGDKITRLVWFGSREIFNITVDEFTSGANSDMILNSFNWMVQNESSLSIHSKVIERQYIRMNSADATKWTILITVVVPVVVLALGMFMWLRRRKK